MSWPPRWWSRGRARPRPDAGPPPAAGDFDEATAAVAQAHRDLERTKARRREVDELTESLRHHRHDNHFAQMFDESLGRGPT